MQVNIPISVGELIDKITILEIKNKKITDEEKLFSIQKELSSLKNILKNLNLENDSLVPLYEELLKVNYELWNIEDEIRISEKNNRFDSSFVELARSVYITNDKRFEIKNKINKLFNSEIKEEKSYEDY
tara:strand:+ start:8925 stop:9311 length:387 start_codon:yes stop_codon:yes gene_type:complete